MALIAQTLLTELQRFCDPPAPVFTGSPTTRPIARDRWAHAFRVYFAAVVDAPITPPQASIQTTFADDVEAAFEARLRLEWSMTARLSAEDFADAWRAGMRAIRAGTGGTIPPSTSTHAWSSWTPTSPPNDIVDDRRDDLADQLTVIFSSPAIVGEPQLRRIAGAFHTASNMLTALSSGGSTITFQ